MSDFIDTRLAPGLWLLGDWSIRFGVLIALVWIGFALRRPRQAALRLAACQLVLLAGLALPLVPRWWGHTMLPARSVATEDVLSKQPTTAAPTPALHPPVAEPKTAMVEPPIQPAPSAEQSPIAIAGPESTSNTPAPAAEPFGLIRITLLIAAALWCVGLCVQSSRLIAGAVCLSRLSQSAGPPSLQSQELFDRCRKEMGLRRTVRLGIHPTLAAPIFVGGWRPSVLVSSDWESLGPEAQRSVLWHELAHAARRDDWAKLAEEFIRAVFFFHPLVYWLLNRIDAYREEVCDSAAVRRGVAGRMLAEVLVDFSRRTAAPNPRDSALRPALPFFRRRTVKNRIHELLEEKTLARWSAPLRRGQVVGLAVIALSIGIALGGFGHAASASDADLTVADDGPPKSPTAAPLSTSEKARATTKGVTKLKTLERILANWKAREERTRSLCFLWESRLFVGQAAEDRSKGKGSLEQAHPRSSRVTMWSARPYRFRLDRAPLAASSPLATTFAEKTRSVTAGLTNLSIQEPANADGLPVATLAARRDQSPLPTGTLALTLTFDPPSAFRLNSPSREFRVVSEDALVNGRHCVEIQISNERGNLLEKCWVDPARDDIVVAYEFWFPVQGRRQPNSALSIEYQLDRVHGWVPARWTATSSGARTEDTVTKYTINEPIPRETFSLKLAPGTIVSDARSVELYRATADGGKSDVVKFDSPASLRVAGVLESRSDFRIEPQRLKDALDFIAARYQIPIFATPLYEAADIDPRVEVGPVPAGIKVAELLKMLLAKCPERIGFRIEDEVLKISPKFKEQGAFRARPAPAPQMPESPQARKIRETLEQPVDFGIEPQSLKDALDFIAARYQIKIKIQPHAPFDGSTEVKGSFPGIKLRSLLSVLLEQVAGPPEFKIEDDVLKIYSKAPAR